MSQTCPRERQLLARLKRAARLRNLPWYWYEYEERALAQGQCTAVREDLLVIRRGMIRDARRQRGHVDTPLHLVRGGRMDPAQQVRGRR